MENVAIASSVVTLEDYLKTDVCQGKVIHCQFGIGQSQLTYFQKCVDKIGINEVRFNNGVILKRSV
jgi:hypothetical protein